MTLEEIYSHFQIPISLDNDYISQLYISKSLYEQYKSEKEIDLECFWPCN